MDIVQKIKRSLHSVLDVGDEVFMSHRIFKVKQTEAIE